MIYKANLNNVTHGELIINNKKHKAVYAGEKLVWEKSQGKVLFEWWHAGVYRKYREKVTFTVKDRKISKDGRIDWRIRKIIKLGTYMEITEYEDDPGKVEILFYLAYKAKITRGAGKPFLTAPSWSNISQCLWYGINNVEVKTERTDLITGECKLKVEEDYSSGITPDRKKPDEIAYLVRGFWKNNGEVESTGYFSGPKSYYVGARWEYASFENGEDTGKEFDTLGDFLDWIKE